MAEFSTWWNSSSLVSVTLWCNNRAAEMFEIWVTVWHTAVCMLDLIHQPFCLTLMKQDRQLYIHCLAINIRLQKPLNNGMHSQLMSKLPNKGYKFCLKWVCFFKIELHVHSNKRSTISISIVHISELKKVHHLIPEQLLLYPVWNCGVFQSKNTSFVTTTAANNNMTSPSTTLDSDCFNKIIKIYYIVVCHLPGSSD